MKIGTLSRIGGPALRTFAAPLIAAGVFAAIAGIGMGSAIAGDPYDPKETGKQHSVIHGKRVQPKHEHVQKRLERKKGVSKKAAPQSE